jgi:UDP-N-acetyl-D-glucosamine dehydrogenase
VAKAGGPARFIEQMGTERTLGNAMPSLAPLETLREKIETGTVHVGVIGMGYVGLPLALNFVERARYRVTGFDVDDAKVTALSAGESYIMYIGVERVAAACRSGLFDATSDMDRLKEPDVLIIAVPTPLTAQRTPDLGFVVGTTEEIRRRLRPGQLVILESTTYPGTTDGPMLSILERDTGLVHGRDFWLAFSPEREDPGNREYSTGRIPKLVGGMNADATAIAAAFYGKAVDQIVTVSSTKVAEATKLTENVFRSVNIALVNELKVIFDRMGIDVWEVLDAAATKPFGFMRFSPGPGLGGHCIPLDPYYLAWKARESGIPSRFIELAGEINTEMPRYVVAKLQQAFDGQEKAVKGSSIVILGIAYKKDIDDPRESPAFALMSRLLELGAECTYHDPHIPRMPRMRTWPNLPSMSSIDLTAELLSAADAVVVVTDHSSIDYGFVRRYAQLIVDTRGVYRDEPGASVVRA